MFEIIEVPRDAPEIFEQLGTKDKFWYTGPDGLAYLFKYGREGTGENWAEVAASKLCDLIGLPHAEYQFGLCDGKHGVISKSFVPEGARLVHGNELIVEIQEGTQPEQFYKRRDHTLDLVLPVIQENTLNPPMGCKGNPDGFGPIDFFIGYLMFDTVIGNQDRHYENWAIIESAEGDRFLSPTYDHASSLGRNESDERRSQLLKAPQERHSITNYVQRARSAFFSAGGGKKPMRTIDVLFVSRQDPKTRVWAPVGRLDWDGDYFRYAYTHGAKNAPNFRPFDAMKSLETIYKAKELFPLFANRMIPESRSDYVRLLSWLNVSHSERNPLVILGLTGGLRKTDPLEIFPCPMKSTNGRYEVSFFNRGLSHLEKSNKEKALGLEKGERLFLMHDMQNPRDRAALVLRTDDPASIVGYCPKHFTKDFHQLIEKCGPDIVTVTVDKVNKDAPTGFALLCKFSSPWPDDFEPCSGEDYLPIPKEMNKDDSCVYVNN